MNSASHVPGYDALRVGIASLGYEPREPVLIKIGHIAGHDQVPGGPPAEKSGFYSGKRPEMTAYIRHAGQAQISVPLRRTDQGYIAGRGANLGRHILQKQTRIPPQTCFIAPHARAEPADEHETGRPHAQMVAFWKIFSGYNREKQSLAFLSYDRQPQARNVGTVAQPAHPAARRFIGAASTRNEVWCLCGGARVRAYQLIP